LLQAIYTITIKIITYNCGLLSVKLFGINIFENPKYVDERIKFIPDEIIKKNADIVGLQECYSKKHIHYLIEKLKKKYKYYSFYNTETLIKKHNGLILFSKYPILYSEFKKHQKNHMIESLFSSKGFLLCEINIPKIGLINIINVHMTSFNTDLILFYQLSNILFENLKNNTIILGDFNCGPDYQIDDYNFIINNNMINTLDLIKNENICKHTWNSNILLNKTGYHSNYSSSLIDHILIHKNLLNVFLISEDIISKLYFISDRILLKFSFKSYCLFISSSSS